MKLFQVNGKRQMYRQYFKRVLAVVLAVHPISLTLHVCNMLASIFRDRIINHLSRYKLINQSQNGFVQRRSVVGMYQSWLKKEEK